MTDGTCKLPAAAPGRKRRTGKKKLVAFGRFLHHLRDSRPGLTQTGVSKALNCPASVGVHLESGRITNPDKEMLDAIARLYHLQMPTVVAALVMSKYDIDVSRSALMALESLTLEQLAEWEAADKTGDLWIIKPSLNDAGHGQLRDALLTRIRSGRCTHFFLPESEYGARGEYTKLKHRLLGVLNDSTLLEDYLIPHILEPQAARWLRCGMVIANPNQILSSSRDVATAGYFVFMTQRTETDALFDALVADGTADQPEGDVRGLCLPMSPTDLRMQVEAANECLTGAGHSNRLQDVATNRNALLQGQHKDTLSDATDETEGSALAKYRAFQLLRSDFKGAVLNDVSSMPGLSVDGIMTYRGTRYAVQVVRVTSVADVVSLKRSALELIDQTKRTGAMLMVRVMLVLVYDQLQLMTRDERQRVKVLLDLERFVSLRFYSLA